MLFGLIRRLAFLALLPAAILIPYLASNGNWDKIKNKVGGWFAKKDSQQVAFDPDIDAPPTPPGKPGQPIAVRTPYRASTSTIDRLEHVIRFDVSPQWVMQQWSEVNTATGDLDMDGMRVALVTGTRESDLAGSLTYYFDSSHRVQRLTFVGTTGDPRRLADMVMRYFHMKQVQSLNGSLFLSQWNGVITSALEVTRAAKIRSDAPHSRYVVRLELNRPSRRYGLSQQMMTRVKAAKDAGRW